MCNGDALFKARTGFVQSTDCTLQSAASCTQGFTVMKPILTLTHERTWEQALAPHSKSVLYTVVRALEIKRQQLLYIHPEGQLKRLVWFVRDLAPLEDWTRLAGMESGAFVGSFFDIQLHLQDIGCHSFQWNKPGIMHVHVLFISKDPREILGAGQQVSESSSD